ncbi:metal ABC transporter substrate-binding protein [Hamadaea tsunoensis]|uniref:metal ABC transporter substrate-binding protein n=1 Tax=Hamadaea tsunoensis TaxID=53368 RepID=UPI00042A4693|nr:metal ABC transporter substrate-binding protein [Hamadaea tsunoensis]
MRRSLLGTVLLASALVLAACGKTALPDAGGRLTVVAAFYPLQFVSERVGGDAVSVTNLTAPGAEPHDLELTPRQVAQIAEAQVVVYLKGLQPDVDKAVAEQAKGTVIDVSELVPMLTATGEAASEAPGLHGRDPHVWLDPTRLSTITAAVAAKLGAADSGHASTFTANAAKLEADLGELDMEYAAGLQTCARKQIFTSHAAFAYLAQRYGLQQVALSGLDPEIEPTPKQLAQVAQQARESGATTIFYETLVSPKVAETIAREVGIKAEVLDPIEGLAPGAGGDYLSIMGDNLSTLRTALGCS